MKFTKLFNAFFTRKRRGKSKKNCKKKIRKTKRRYTMHGG